MWIFAIILHATQYLSSITHLKEKERRGLVRLRDRWYKKKQKAKRERERERENNYYKYIKFEIIIR